MRAEDLTPLFYKMGAVPIFLKEKQMPFKASDIKITIKVKKIISVFKKLHIYKIKIGSHSFFWLITYAGIYRVEKKELFPYFKLIRAAT